MRKIISILATAIILLSSISFFIINEASGLTQNISLSETNNDISSRIIQVEFSKDELDFNSFMGYDIISIKDGGFINDIGKPMLPIKNALVALPNGMKATDINIISKTYERLPGSYNIIPAQPAQKISDEINLFNNLIIDYKTYYSLNSYSSSCVKLSSQTDMLGQSIAVVQVRPLQYNPLLKSVNVLKELKFEITGENGYVYGDYLPLSYNDEQRQESMQEISSIVINPEDVQLQTNPSPQPLTLEPGDYDYVIITKNAWASAFQDLANWKTQKGVPANIVTTEWIYTNYTGTTNKAKIRAFIIDAHSTWGTTMFLLGGDTDTIPYHTVTYGGDTIPTDTYYADYDSDWTIEVNVGRASVTGTGTGAGKIGNFISKTLNYEQNPPTTNYAKNVALFGFDLDWTTDGEDCKIDIDNLYIPSTWTVTTVYDSQGGNHEDYVDTAVNAGQNLINHIDHCNEYAIGTGSYNHDLHLDTSEVDAFSNGNKQSIFYTIGCWASAFDFDNCISEHFVRDTNGGGVGFVGNTRYGWYYVGGDDQASLRYDRYFFRSFFSQNHYQLGDLFSDHKMDAYLSMSQDDLNKYIFSELNLLGDPELPIWTENPLSFVANHPTEILLGPSSFTVHVEDSVGTDIANAYVCLWKGDEVYLTGLTNSNGDITFNPNPLTEGTMKVTVTKKDYIPYLGNVIVTAGNHAPDAPSNPSPAHGAVDVSINADLSWDCSDPDGDPLTFNVYFGTTSPPPLVSSGQSATSYDPGTLNYYTQYFWQIVAFDNQSASTNGTIWDFTTIEANNPPYEPSQPQPSDGATDVDINADISWTGGDPDAGDIVTYDVYFGTNSNPPLVATGISTNTYEPGTMQYETMYYWKIVSFDNNGASTTGPIWDFTTKEKTNSAPQKPETPSGPMLGAINIEYTYSSRTTDVDGDQIYYWFDWGDGTNSGWIGPYDSGATVSAKHTWTTIGLFSIKVKAKDIYNAESDWSDVLPITIPKNKASFFSFYLLEKILERFPNAFFILRQLLKI